MRVANRLLALIVAAGTTLPASVAAQPNTRDHRRPPAGPPPPAPAAAGPTEAPPALRDEKIETRAGFVWVRGRWDWRASKWEWIPGHWERARAGKKWREGRWEPRNGTWVWTAGGWVGENEATPPPVTPPPPVATTPPPVATTPPPPAAPPPGGWPTSPPPAPKTESHEPTRAGFVWIDGAWDWRSDKWEWVPGHWERERAGKRWRAQRWEQREGRWQRFDGDWEDASAQTPPPVAPPGTRSRREWKLDRPVVDRYWPAKGKVGTKVVIRGKNFPATAEITFGGQPVKAVKVKDNQIAFVIPPNAASGEIAVRAGGRRPLVVGRFEVAAGFDPIAEQKRIEEEQRKKAEELWAARQKQLAKDRAAREAAIRQRQEERAASRERRRAERVAALQTKWERAFLADEETQAELTLHGQRTAELDRMLDLAEIAANAKLAVRIEVARQREESRHEQRMASLQASFKLGGRP